MKCRKLIYLGYTDLKHLYSCLKDYKMPVPCYVTLPSARRW
jgi:hypothetical protein